MRLVFEQIRSGGDRNFGYLLGDRETGAGVLIHPSYSPDVFVERARAQNLAVTHIINTHSHHDHTNGNERAVELTGAALAAHPHMRPTVPLDDGHTLAIGNLRLTAYHVPGHCDDHIALYESVYKLVITGDLLFVGKVGGTGTDEDALTEWRSLQRLLAIVPDDATMWPGHDYGARPSSTIALERQTNPFLLAPDEHGFLRTKADWPRIKQRLGLK
jgi:glyoxylase-like metal-dependent hydrolase (beta-lactamase superfamily II)